MLESTTRQKMKKPLLLSVISAAAVVTMGASAQDVLAGTIAFVTGGLLSGSMEECLKDMKTAADKTGFSEFQETIFDEDKKAGDFHADLKGSPLHLTARCDPPTGVWSVAVSGIDPEKTVEGYNKFIRSLD